MNADKFVVRGQTYDVLSPATFGDYIETVGAACINPLGYDENKLFLAYDDNVQKLFRATTAIANSELLIKDTNCEPTTMAEALANALSAGGVSYDNTDSGLTASNVQGAIDEVNGDVETVNNDLSNLSDDLMTETVARSELGAHNLLVYPFRPDIWSSGSYYINGITYTDNKDGSITMQGNSGIDNAETQLHGRVLSMYPMWLKPGTYIASCKGLTGSSNLRVATTKNSSYTEIVRVTLASGEQEFTITASSSDYTTSDGRVLIAIYLQGSGVVNTTVYPMIRLASDLNDEFSSYAKPNDELTEIVRSIGKQRFAHYSFVVSANAVSDASIDVSRTGYKPIGIIGTQIGSSGAKTAIVSSILDVNNVNAATAFVRIVNWDSTPKTVDIVLDVLYIKEGI